MRAILNVDKWIKRAGVLIAIYLTHTCAIATVPQEGWLDNPPEVYQVKRGDTLWSIAAKYLHDPWRWSDLWQSNPDIGDPNRIYPGDKLMLTHTEGGPRLTLERKKSRAPLTSRVVKLHPKIRYLPPDMPIPTIPLNVIRPFLNESRVVTKKQADHCPRVVALQEDHILVGTGDRLYVSGLSKHPKNTVYDVFCPNKTYVDPKTKQPLGIEGLVAGKVELEVLGDPARLLVTKCFSEIKIGDRLMSTGVERLDPYFVPRYPATEAKGQIISVFGGLNQIGQYQVLVITGGQDKHRAVGDVLGIYQDNKDIPRRFVKNEHYNYDFPPYHIGRCVVFRVFDRVSYVLVMKAIRPIYLYDEVWVP